MEQIFDLTYVRTFIDIWMLSMQWTVIIQSIFLNKSCNYDKEKNTSAVCLRLW